MTHATTESLLGSSAGLFGTHAPDIGVCVSAGSSALPKRPPPTSADP
ncbi:hypothetical protein LRS13_07665 [Svornostia abyssi]|uniref:Uncharacterized protein n=1 Tax=Svornostia abyssi TaxID=2898438 RepID=A0ABY5PL89_9ACTN|nr:hypothetical protein LRS13_07665 [Parviterribacteraceae bacterium J379]